MRICKKQVRRRLLHDLYIYSNIFRNVSYEAAFKSKYAKQNFAP